MCDQAKLQNWAKDALSRRQFGALAGAAALTACSQSDQAGLPEQQAGARTQLGDSVSFDTADGTMDARFFAGPDGPAPAIIHWPDIAGIRRSHLEMAQRTADAGFAVLLVNPYYRDAKGEIWPDFASFADGGWDRARAMRANLSSFAIKRDTQAIVAWLDGQASVDANRGIGAEGYCMGGPFTVYSAHAVPDRVKAAASFHGGGLVRDDGESPHRLLTDTTAQYLIAIAKDDDASAPNDKVALRKAADDSNAILMVEVYDGDHGWTVPDSPAYAKEAAERAFAEKIKLYQGAL